MVCKSNLLLHTDDSCLLYQHKDIAKIEKMINEDFENICDWFVGKNKSILFRKKQRAKNIRKLNTRYKEINIKQQAKVTYFGSVLDESMSAEPLALNIINTINGKVKFLNRKQINTRTL